MQQDGRTRALATLAAATAVTVALMAGCEDSASPTSPAGPPMTGNVAGSWAGTYSHNDLDSCDVRSLPAQATFEQDGSMVRGALSTASDPCGLQPLTFTGTIQGNQLAGKAFQGGIETFGTVRGTLSGSALEIAIGVNNFGYASLGQMYLHR